MTTIEGIIKIDKKWVSMSSVPMSPSICNKVALQMAKMIDEFRKENIDWQSIFYVEILKSDVKNVSQALILEIMDRGSPSREMAERIFLISKEHHKYLKKMTKFSWTYALRRFEDKYKGMH